MHTFYVMCTCGVMCTASVVCWLMERSGVVYWATRYLVQEFMGYVLSVL